MKDRVSLYPGRVKLTPVSGQENTYDMVRADEPTQEGDHLSKATFLKDATAALFGLDATAVPDDALYVLSRFHKGLGNEYVWEKSTSSVEYKYTVINTAPYNAYTGATNQGGTVYIPYGDGFTINSTNEFVLTNRQELVFAYNGNNQTKLNILAGKYFFTGTGNSGIQSNVNITKCPIDSTVIIEYGQFKMTKCEVYGNGQAVTSKTVYGYVNSPDPNAYPPAVSDGYTYTALGQLGNKVQIATGSYIGTGTYGKANPTSLTFGFEPKLVIVWIAYQPSENYGLRPASNSGAWNSSFIYTKGQCRTNIYYNNTNYPNELSVVGNTLSWYTKSNNAPYGQLNQSGVTYEYLAIG